MAKNVAAGPVMLVNTRKMAELTGYTPYTIREKAKEGKIPHEKWGRSLRFSPEAVIAALRSMR